jgi:hypothetical protein
MPVVIDWDDTVLPSTHLSSVGYKLGVDIQRSPHIDETLKNLENVAVEWLSLLTSKYTVIIITNAQAGWVQQSAQKFIPAILPMLAKCKIVSARTDYEQSYPNKPVMWKTRAFVEHVRPTEQLISFGDSVAEREAAKLIGRMFKDIHVKSIKFAERPTIEQLQRQIQLVVKSHDFIIDHGGSLDLMLTITLVSSENTVGSKSATPCLPVNGEYNDNIDKSCSQESQNVLRTL